MSKMRYKNQITDSIVDARDIIKNVGRGIEMGKIDVPSNTPGVGGQRTITSTYQLG